jgi:hypothetical protein
LLLFASVAVPASFVPSVWASRSGYTWSLLIFAVPALAITTSLARRGLLARLQGPVVIAWLLLVPMGITLNLLFADDFFVYPNQLAVAGLSIPALDWGQLDRVHPIPVEEFAFYALGFLAMLLGYAWVDGVMGERRSRLAPGPLAWRSAVAVPLALSSMGALLAPAVPAYWLYLCLVPLPPTIAFWPHVRARLNLKALSVTVILILGASFVWEAQLAVPRGWWGYSPDAMLGWWVAGVPIEAVVVWLLAPITTAVLFEVVRSRWRPS